MAEVQELVRIPELTDGQGTNEAFAEVAVVTTGGLITDCAVGAAFPRSATSGFAQQSFPWSAPYPVAGAVALKTTAELETVWAEHRGLDSALPQVDFERSMVLAVFAGEGFFREVPCIERVKVLADEVVVYVSHFSRPWSKHNAKAVVQVPRQELPVRFVYLS